MVTSAPLRRLRAATTDLLLQVAAGAAILLLGPVPVAGQTYQRSGAHFSVTFQGPADEAIAFRSVEILEAAYYRIGSALNVYPTQPIDVVLHTQQQFFDVTKAPSWAGGLYDGRIHVPVKGAEKISPERLAEVLSHELTHAIARSIAGPEGPTWLHEGLAGVMEQSGPADEQAFMAQTSARLSLSSLMKGFDQLSEDGVHLAYAQSAIAVKRLIDLRGASAVVGLLRALKTGAPFENAFQAHVGMRFQDFDAMVTR
jgi:hypothetical protein